LCHHLIVHDPGHIYQGHDLSAKVAASRLTVDRVRKLLSEGCKKLRERSIPR